MTTEDREIVKMMEQYGGSFVKSLTRAIYCADTNNFQKIKDAFPELWVRYREFVKEDISELPTAQGHGRSQMMN